MIDVNELRKGVTFTMDGELYKVLEYQHYKPGRGNAVIRTKLRNLRSGSTISRNFVSGERVEDVRVERRGVQYLYQDSDFYYFMDKETFEQFPIGSAILGDQADFLKEGMEVVLTQHEGEALDVDLPTTIDYEVVESEMAVAGDTATNVLKKVKTDTGLEVAVPLFIQVGDTIRVDTRDRSYVTRV